MDADGNNNAGEKRGTYRVKKIRSHFHTALSIFNE